MGLTAERVRELGFRKWYERQLIDSHLALVTCVLCMILVGVSLEELTFKHGFARGVLMLALTGSAGALGWFALRRYLKVFTHAQRLSERSVCAQCGTYGRFKIIDHAADDIWLRVQCRKCGHVWTLE